MSKYEIIVGSVLGASEYVADAIEEVLTSKGHESTIHLTPDINEIPTSSTWIICSSTHGAGDFPDNIETFATSLEQAKLSDVNFIVIGLGDSSYDTYCHASIKLEELMKNAGATLLHDALHIDVLNHPIPEDIATEWLSEKLG